MKTVEYLMHQKWMRSTVLFFSIILLLQASFLNQEASSRTNEIQNFDNLYFQALVNSSARQYKEALPKLEAANKLRPNDADCLEAIASTYIHLRKHGQAIPFARKAAALDKEFEQPRLNLATALLATG
ncbi:MAG: hypothetical protein IAF58_03370, partial [Leptolyngbya sp.]|nr:hypothetical protein [Candidatus Melainabacteria bacterium]